MLTKELKAIFAQMLYNDKDMLFGECGPSLSKVEKQEKWIEIFIKLNAMGANLPDYKTLRDIEWSNMRRAAEKKLSSLNDDGKSEEEKMSIRPLTSLDEIVLDILGKGSGKTEKSEIEIPENAAFLDPSFMAKIKYEDDEEEENLVDENDDSLGLDDYDPRASNPPPKRRKRRRGGASNARSMRVPSPVVNITNVGSPELNELRKKKLRLECTKLELDIEKLPLECAMLELEIQKLQRDLIGGHHGGVM